MTRLQLSGIHSLQGFALQGDVEQLTEYPELR